MKARVKATRAIIDVKEVTKYSSNYAPSTVYEDVTDGIIYKKEFLDFENVEDVLIDVKEKSFPKDEPDYWEKLKHQAAISAMQGLLSNSAYLENFIKYSVEGDSLARVVSTNAIDYATALINRLKEQEK